MAIDYLNTSLIHLPSLGEKKAQLLSSEVDIETYRDLLYYFPFRYIDRTQVFKVRDLTPYTDEIQLKGIIRDYQLEGVGKKSRLRAIFEDETGSVELIWFAGAVYIPRSYPPGKEYILFGKPSIYNNSYSFTHPEVTPLALASQVVGHLMGVYHTTGKMKRSFLDSRNVRKLIFSLLPIVDSYVEETLPESMLIALHLMPLAQALKIVHAPSDLSLLNQAVYRLKFDELFFLRLSLEKTKLERKQKYQGYRFSDVGLHFNTLYESLPYDLTKAQKRVLKEIRTDTLKGIQMNRLLQGDVGSGKTVVAAFAMMLALDNGLQACIMAPTEILANQHYSTLKELFEPLELPVALWTGSTKKSEREEIKEAIMKGELNILVGTHALLEEGVTFKELGIAIIDEQHRFGVAQRAKLWKKNDTILPHILIMSATPIPRTLAMTLYGDLDISIIDELPPGRKPIKTALFTNDQQEKVYRFISEKITEGRQVYVVYPMIEGTEESDFKNLETGYKQFANRFGSNNITYVHGKLNAKEKQEKMDLFIGGEVPILLSTTVIEVGVNVPNATVMVIENANRFGLAQLHQLRGRVGRGADQSYCLLIAPQEISYTAKKRLQVMTQTTDGFVIAEEDMKLRGEGDLEGTRQSGDLPGLNLASPSRDMAILRTASYYAEAIVAKDPNLETPENSLIKKEINRLYPPEASWGKIS